MIIPKRCVVVETEAIAIDKLKEVLPRLAFRECSKDMEESWGFYQFDELSDCEELAYTVDRFTILNIRRDRKKLNKTKLSRAWNQELVKQEKAAGMVFDKPKREEVREQVKKEMFKDKEPDETYIKGVYDSIKNRIYILVSDPSSAEFFVEKLNRALEPQKINVNFKVDTLMPVLTETLTNWLCSPHIAEEYGFEVGQDMMLKGEQSSSATLKHQVADSSEVKEHLHNSKMAHKLELITSDDQGVDVSFVITNTHILSQINLKALCSPQIKIERENHSDVAAMKDAEFLIWFNALSSLYDKTMQIPKG